MKNDRAAPNLLADQKTEDAMAQIAAGIAKLSESLRKPSTLEMYEEEQPMTYEFDLQRLRSDID